jgi:choline dehydrogenase-like flavoprotein
MALGHILGGSGIDAMVWIRGMQPDYDGWAENGAKDEKQKAVFVVRRFIADALGGVHVPGTKRHCTTAGHGDGFARRRRKWSDDHGHKSGNWPGIHGCNE